MLSSWSSEATNDRIVILGTNKLLEQLCNSNLWLADGTSSSCPNPFSQLVTIFGNNVSGDAYTCYGFLWILMTGKLIELYRQVFILITKLATEAGFVFNVKHFLSDFESASGTAFQQIFPDAKLHYSYFDFVQNQIKFLNKNGFPTQLQEPPVVDVRNQVSALAYLPPSKIRAAFEAIKEMAPPGLESYFKYFEDNYLNGSFLISNWSINHLLFSNMPISQNFVESSHRKRNMIQRDKTPKFYDLTNQLAKQASQNELDIDHHLLYGTTLRKRSKM